MESAQPTSEQPTVTEVREDLEMLAGTMIQFQTKDPCNEYQMAVAYIKRAAYLLQNKS
jgi:hypothetical protein